jgi:hypothetical protein
LLGDLSMIHSLMLTLTTSLMQKVKRTLLAVLFSFLGIGLIAYLIFTLIQDIILHKYYKST